MFPPNEIQARGIKATQGGKIVREGRRVVGCTTIYIDG